MKPLRQWLLTPLLVLAAAPAARAHEPLWGETPQTFETAEDFEARAEWNLLQPRLTRPAAPRLSKLAAGRPLYFKGTSTNLRPNDPLIVDFGAAGVAAFRVIGVELDQAADRTKVSVQLWAQAAAPAVAAVAAATFELEEATPGGLTVGMRTSACVSATSSWRLSSRCLWI